MSYDDYCHCQILAINYYHCKRTNIIVITINVTIRNINRVSQITVYYPCLMSIIYPVKNMIIVTMNDVIAIIVTYY